jgi:hypothetical protein
MDKPWRYYDTAHVTYYPKLMTVEELEKSYDWYGQPTAREHGPAWMAHLRRHRMSRMPRKVFGGWHRLWLPRDI